MLIGCLCSFIVHFLCSTFLAGVIDRYSSGMNVTKRGVFAELVRRKKQVASESEKQQEGSREPDNQERQPKIGIQNQAT
jgi:hypothetical protein